MLCPCADLPAKLWETRKTQKSSAIFGDISIELPHRKLEFVKRTRISLMKLTYADNFRVIGRNQWCSWTIKIDGEDCPTPIYNSKSDSSSANDNTPHAIVGTCAGIAAGKHIMTISLTRNTGADCFTGWSASSSSDAFFMEAEEINPSGQITSVLRADDRDSRKSGLVSGRKLVIDKRTEKSELRITWNTNLHVGATDRTDEAHCDWEVLIDGISCSNPSKIGVSLHSRHVGNGHIPAHVVGWCKGIKAGLHTVTVMVTDSSSNSNCETGWGASDYMEVWEPTPKEQAMMTYVQKFNTNSGTGASNSALSSSFTKMLSSTSVRILYYDNLRVVGDNKWCRWEVKVDGLSCSAPLAASVNHYTTDNEYPGIILGECLGVAAGAHKIKIVSTNSVGADCYSGWTSSPRVMHSLIEIQEVNATQQPACNVPNSNKQRGSACACLPGYWGTITWNVEATGPCTSLFPSVFPPSCISNQSPCLVALLVCVGNR